MKASLSTICKLIVLLTVSGAHSSCKRRSGNSHLLKDIYTTNQDRDEDKSKSGAFENLIYLHLADASGDKSLIDGYTEFEGSDISNREIVLVLNPDSTDISPVEIGDGETLNLAGGLAAAVKRIFAGEPGVVKPKNAGEAEKLLESGSLKSPRQITASGSDNGLLPKKYILQENTTTFRGMSISIPEANRVLYRGIDSPLIYNLSTGRLSQQSSEVLTDVVSHKKGTNSSSLGAQNTSSPGSVLVSTSTDLATAKNFAGGAGVVFVIKARKGKAIDTEAVAADNPSLVPGAVRGEAEIAIVGRVKPKNILGYRIVKTDGSLGDLVTPKQISRPDFTSDNMGRKLGSLAVDRDQASKLLSKTGDYLVRKSQNSDDYVISINSSGSVLHMLFKNESELNSILKQQNLHKNRQITRSDEAYSELLRTRFHGVKFISNTGLTKKEAASYLSHKTIPEGKFIVGEYPGGFVISVKAKDGYIEQFEFNQAGDAYKIMGELNLNFDSQIKNTVVYMESILSVSGMIK